MTRIAVGVEYDGRQFSGWQTQRGERTVQQTVESALSCVANEPVELICAGRTDAGVHATYQVVHFDTSAERWPRGWVLGANSNLPADASVIWAKQVSDDFHARFSARARAYQYLICCRQSRPGLWHGKTAWEHQPLNVERMSEASQYLVGEHDFSAFRASGCQARSPVRTISDLSIESRAGQIVLSVTANAFLQHMVRNLVGVLLKIGRGERPPFWAREVLKSRDRSSGGITATPDGLYLVDVRYEEKFDLPAAQPLQAHLPFFSGAGFPDEREERG